MIRKHSQRPATLLLAALALLLAPHLGAAETPASGKNLPVILLTGFEPFGGLEKNASWETVKTFEGKEIAGYKIATALLPVVYDEMAEPLKKAIEKNKPEIVISFGVGTEVMQTELIARNGYHRMKPKDNKGQRPPREKIDPNGKDEIPTLLPAAAIVKALMQAKIGAQTSKDAGGYLCNECFYRLMETEVQDAPIKLRGFVHVPDFGTPDPAGGAFTAEKLIKAAQIVIEETAKAAKSPAPAPAE
ncbi:MAG: pyroglutamyl-peptidase I, partial [Planctomycetes bacterium]|nr:pyroglutamyl-peptidase I [Planctomycetota bacterium]